MTDIIIKTACVDSATLASQTATTLDATMADFKEATLLTKVKTEINGDWPNVSTDNLLCVLGYGDMGLGQLAAAFTTQVIDTENAQQYREDQTAVRGIVDFVALKVPVTAGNVMAQSIVWDLPKGGLSSAKGNGWRLFLYNPSDTTAFTNGPTICATTKWYVQRLGS